MRCQPALRMPCLSPARLFATQIPPAHAKLFYLYYANYEEEYGLARRAMVSLATSVCWRVVCVGVRACLLASRSIAWCCRWCCVVWRGLQAIYERAVKAVLPEQQLDMYTIYITRAAELFGTSCLLCLSNQTTWRPRCVVLWLVQVFQGRARSTSKASRA